VRRALKQLLSASDETRDAARKAAQEKEDSRAHIRALELRLEQQAQAIEALSR
jgi:hypothetical protein